MTGCVEHVPPVTVRLTLVPFVPPDPPAVIAADATVAARLGLSSSWGAVISSVKLTTVDGGMLTSITYCTAPVVASDGVYDKLENLRFVPSPGITADLAFIPTPPDVLLLI